MSSNLSKRRAQDQPIPPVPPNRLWATVQWAITRVGMIEKRDLSNRHIETAVDFFMDKSPEASTAHLALTSRQWVEVAKTVTLGLDEEEAVARSVCCHQSHQVANVRIRVVRHCPAFEFVGTEGQRAMRPFVPASASIRNVVAGRLVKQLKSNQNGRFQSFAMTILLMSCSEKRRATVSPPSTDAGASVDVSSQLPELAHTTKQVQMTGRAPRCQLFHPHRPLQSQHRHLPPKNERQLPLRLSRPFLDQRGRNLV